MSARHVVAVVAGALTLGALFNADDLRATAERQELGWQRTVALTLVEPVDGLSRLLRLDRPRGALDLALGRDESPRKSAERAALEARVLAALPARAGSAPSRRPVSAHQPLRLFVGGDSMVGQFGPALARLASASGVVEPQVVYEFASGLSRPDFVDWPARLRQVGTEFAPDAVVLVFGGNDAQPLQGEGKVLDTGTPEWITEYRARVDELMTELIGAGRRVYWVGMPIVRAPGFRERVELLNEIYRTEAEAHPGVTYIDSWSLFADPNGNYTDYLPDQSGAQTDMRLGDGVHLTTAGGQRLAAAVFRQIAEDWSLPR